MKTVVQSLVAGAFVLAIAILVTSSDAVAGGGRQHRSHDHAHHGAHGKWHDSRLEKRSRAVHGKWRKHDHRLMPRQRAKLKHWRRRAVREGWAAQRPLPRPGRRVRQRHWQPRHSGYSNAVPDFLNGGSAIGAIAGGLIGNQVGSGRGRVLATVGGALLGAIVGNGIYRGIQASDEQRVARVLESTPSGQTISWKNPDTGNSFRVTPSPAFKGADRRDCREYRTWAFIDGYEKELNGIACRDAQGRWQLMNG